MKRYSLFLLVLTFGLSVLSLACGSSGGGGSNPYSGSFNAFVVNSGLEAPVGTMDIAQNGSGGSAVWHPIEDPAENATSVSFSGADMTMTFAGGWVLTGTWSSANLFDGTTTWGGLAIQFRLRRI